MGVVKRYHQALPVLVNDDTRLRRVGVVQGVQPRNIEPFICQCVSHGVRFWVVAHARPHASLPAQFLKRTRRRNCHTIHNAAHVIRQHFGWGSRYVFNLENGGAANRTERYKLWLHALARMPEACCAS